MSQLNPLTLSVTSFAQSAAVGSEIGTILGTTLPPQPTITGAPADALAGTHADFAPVLAGGAAPYALSVATGALPPGRSIAGLVETGSYTTLGDYAYVLRVTDANGQTADLAVAVTVHPSQFVAPYNFQFVQVGDSRTDSAFYTVNGDDGYVGQAHLNGPLAWLPPLMENRIRVASIANYGIGTQATSSVLAVPRPFNATRGIDYAAANEAANVLIYTGTNDYAPDQAAGGASRIAMTKAIDYLTNPSSAAYPSYGGKLYQGLPKNLIILNEHGKGRRDDGTLTGSSGASMKPWADWLLGFDADSGDARANPRVRVIDTFSDPALTDAASGSAYLNVQGIQTDGLHNNPVGAKLIAKRIAASLMGATAYATAPRVALTPIQATFGSYLTANPLMRFGSGAGFQNAGVAFDPTSAGHPDSVLMLGSQGSSGTDPIVSFDYSNGGEMLLTVKGKAGGGSVTLQQAIDVSGIVRGDRIAAMAEIATITPIDAVNYGYAIHANLNTNAGRNIAAAVDPASGSLWHAVAAPNNDGEYVQHILIPLDTNLQPGATYTQHVFASYVRIDLPVLPDDASYRIRSLTAIKL